MKLNKIVQIVFLFTLIFIALSGVSYSQGNPSSEIWIKVKDDAGARDTITNWFGNHINARFNPIDTLQGLLVGRSSCEPNIREVSSPPLPPGFGVVWRNILGRPQNPYGLGLVKYDFRSLPNASNKDTFKLYFQNPEQQDVANFTIRWPDAAYLGQRCDSMVLNYLDPNADPPNIWIDAFTVDSLVLPLATLNGISNIWIYKWGCYLVDGCPIGDVKQESRTIPTGYKLYESYPNPFNPSTTMKFDIEKSSMTDISVYNVLGQKVVTLVSGELSPGTYSTTWNATNNQGNPVSSGVYYIRITAHQSGNQNAKEFSAVQKLLLLK